MLQMDIFTTDKKELVFILVFWLVGVFLLVILLLHTAPALIVLLLSDTSTETSENS